MRQGPEIACIIEEFGTLETLSRGRNIWPSRFAVRGCKRREERCVIPADLTHTLTCRKGLRRMRERPVPRASLPEENDRKDEGAQLDHSNCMQLVGEGLLARLVPEHSAPCIGSADPAKECKVEQGGF